VRVFENRVLRKILGPKRDKVRREWRKLHNEDLHDLYSSLNIIWVINSRRMRWVGHVAGKKSIGRPMCRWEDNIEMDFQDVGWGMDWIDMAQEKDRWRALVNVVMNIRVP
jgi:hypothetical protein